MFSVFPAYKTLPIYLFFKSLKLFNCSYEYSLLINSLFNLNAIILSFFINEEDNNENKTILEENEELEEFEIQANLDEFSMN